MGKTIRVPWIRWQRFRVRGVVRDERTGKPLGGHRVQAFDKDVWSDDFLGECDTDSDGRFEIRFTDADFKDVAESSPDIYLVIWPPGATEPVHSTSSEVREDASDDEYFDISIDAASQS